MARMPDGSPDNGLFHPALRRWDGGARITNNWNTLNNDQELSFRNGDCFVYLREPGRSTRGPSFRIHSSQLVAKGLECLVEGSVTVPLTSQSSGSSLRSSKGRPSSIQALYLPALKGASKSDAVFYHLNTRNLFAWIYNIPMTGKTLGKAMIGLLQRINFLRPGDEGINQKEVMSYLEAQGYLDFRECADHALAALYFAESFEIEHLWIDAFAHCVGLHHNLHGSQEFETISPTTRALILKARLEMDVRLDRVSRSVMNFFELDLSGSFLGLHQTARDHFDRFRSFLQTYYIESYGFWPPANFEHRLQNQRILYRSMYSDFRSLYHYMVDPNSTPSIADNVAASGGLCVLQTIEAFDGRHRFESLPHPLPLIPSLADAESSLQLPTERRNSLNPLRRRKAERDFKHKLSAKALIDASNRDWSVASNPLVRRFEQFETYSVADGFEAVELVDGRKVRWILVYAILQTLVSVTYAPKEVRDPEGLSYALCCHPPKDMPWRMRASRLAKTASTKSKEAGTELEPDINYLESSSSSTSLSTYLTKKERRKSMPMSIASNRSTSSLRGLLMGRSASSKLITTTANRPGFCEIFIQGYGNGLNEAKAVQKNPLDEPTAGLAAEHHYDMALPVTTVSRESSKSSGYSRSFDSNEEDDELTEMDHLSVVGKDSHIPSGSNILDENNELRECHFNTSTWDALLHN